jgi:hypothetical protein
MPPDLRNHLVPTGADTPADTAASSLELPAATAAQNATSVSRRATSGRPGENSLTRPDVSDRRFLFVIATSRTRVLRRPIGTAQYVSITYTERLAAAGIEPSVGSVGDSYDNALAETVIGLFKTEVIRRLGPWRSLEAVEWATFACHRRLLEPIGYVPPAEAEARFCATLEETALAA